MKGMWMRVPGKRNLSAGPRATTLLSNRCGGDRTVRGAPGAARALSPPRPLRLALRMARRTLADPGIAGQRTTGGWRCEDLVERSWVRGGYLASLSTLCIFLPAAQGQLSQPAIHMPSFSRQGVFFSKYPLVTRFNLVAPRDHAKGELLEFLPRGTTKGHSRDVF